jgi:hypothetical protein
MWPASLKSTQSSLTPLTTIKSVGQHFKSVFSANLRNPGTKPTRDSRKCRLNWLEFRLERILSALRSGFCWRWLSSGTLLSSKRSPNYQLAPPELVPLFGTAKGGSPLSRSLCGSGSPACDREYRR